MYIIDGGRVIEVSHDDLIARHHTEKEYKIVKVLLYEVHYRRGKSSEFGRVDYFDNEADAIDCIADNKWADYLDDERAGNLFHSKEDAESFLNETKKD